jgi:hypothetical protein
MLLNSGEYLRTIELVKQEIKSAQYRAAVHVNTDMILLYHSIGCIINEHKAWGNKFIDNLAADIRLEFPDSKGYSVRNLKYMAKFALAYPDQEFVQQVVAQIPWGTMSFCLTRFRPQRNGNGILMPVKEMAGLEQSCFTKLKAASISVRRLPKRCLISQIVCPLRKVS